MPDLPTSETAPESEEFVEMVELGRRAIAGKTSYLSSPELAEMVLQAAGIPSLVGRAEKAETERDEALAGEADFKAAWESRDQVIDDLAAENEALVGRLVDAEAALREIATKGEDDDWGYTMDADGYIAAGVLAKIAKDALAAALTNYATTQDESAEK